MHELKYKVGQKVIVVADEFASGRSSHYCTIGDEYIIVKTEKESRKGIDCNFQEYQLDNGFWVTETEIKCTP